MTTQPTPDNFVETPQEFLSDRCTSTDPDPAPESRGIGFEYLAELLEGVAESLEPHSREHSQESLNEPSTDPAIAPEQFISEGQQAAIVKILSITLAVALKEKAYDVELNLEILREYVVALRSLDLPTKSVIAAMFAGDVAYTLQQNSNLVQAVNVKTSEFLVYQDVTLHWDGHDYPTKITRRCFDPDSKQWVYQTRQFTDLVAASDLTSR